MFLSKVEFDPAQLGAAVRQLRGNRFQEHQMIWNLLSRDPDQRRNFLYRREDSDGLPFYYLLSADKPQTHLSFLQVATRDYSPQLQQGDHLSFTLRANAVISRKTTADGKQRIRRSIIEAKIDEYRALEPDARRWPPKAYIHHEAGEAWLQRQGEKLGFRIEELSVQNHQHHQFTKPGNKKDAHCRQFTTLDFSGVLAVSDVHQFTQLALQSGLGRAKAYGCGLLLVKRV